MYAVSPNACYILKIEFSAAKPLLFNVRLSMEII